MAKVSYVQIPPGMEEAYKKVLQPVDRFVFSRVRVKNLFVSRSRVAGITQKSMLVILAPIWAALAPAVQTQWGDASAASKLSGWKGFVYDTAARKRAGLSGYATPQTVFQAMVGRMQISSPATGLLLEQAHPSTYYVLRKVSGTKSEYSPKAVNEPFSLPLTIGISWKTALTALDIDARARFYCTVYSSYQGRTLETTLSIPFGFSDSWTRASASLSTVVGSVTGYSAFIEVYNARGNLYFDNVSISHAGENWARDPNCNSISASFTRAFFQVARHWVAVNPTEGIDYGSVYCADLPPTPPVGFVRSHYWFYSDHLGAVDYAGFRIIPC